MVKPRDPLRQNPNEQVARPRARGPFGPLDRPRIDVRHADGRWYPGRLHGWVSQHRGWWAVASYETTPGIQFYTCLAADDVRPAARSAAGSGHGSLDDA